MMKRIVPVMVLLALGAGITALATSGRPDCPGKIVCPLTGEPVCKDRCPLARDLRENPYNSAEGRSRR